MKNLLPIMTIALSLNAFAQTTISLDASQDARISWKENNSAVANTNYSSDEGLSAYAWTSSGDTVFYRGLIQFDISSIPSYATITSATLKLYHNNTSAQGQHDAQGIGVTNETYIRTLSGPWDESTVTWNNQPNHSQTGQVAIGPSQSATENFDNIDLTSFVSQMHSGTIDNYGFVIMLKTEEAFRKLVLASSKHPNSNLHPKLEIEYDVSASVYETGSSVKIYPNPAEDVLILSSSNKLFSVQLFDITGKLLMTKNELNINQLSISLSVWGEGVYLLNLVDINGNMTQERVIVK